MANGLARRTVSRLPRERRVADIMVAARAVFVEKGYDDALLSEIAERANVVEGTIYRYFENKRDLLIKVIETWYEDMLSDYAQDLAGISGTRNRLRYMVWRHLATVHDEPGLCRLMFQVLRPGDDYIGSAVYELNREYTRRTTEIVSEGIAAGELRADLPVTLVRDAIYGAVEHRTWAYLRGQGGDFDPAAVADAIVDLVFDGLRIQRAAPTLDPGLAERLEKAVERLERLGRGA